MRTTSGSRRVGERYGICPQGHPVVIVAVDFDGVLHNPDDVAPGHKMGRPVEGAVQAVLDLSHLEDTVIVHSCRANTPAGLAAMVAWLEWAGLADDVKVWDQPGKPVADVYVDDRGIGFTSWSEVFSAIGRLFNREQMERRDG